MLYTVQSKTNLNGTLEQRENRINYLADAYLVDEFSTRFVTANFMVAEVAYSCVLTKLGVDKKELSITGLDTFDIAKYLTLTLPLSNFRKVPKKPKKPRSNSHARYLEVYAENLKNYEVASKYNARRRRYFSMIAQIVILELSVNTVINELERLDIKPDVDFYTQKLRAIALPKNSIEYNLETLKETVTSIVDSFKEPLEDGEENKVIWVSGD